MFAVKLGSQSIREPCTAGIDAEAAAQILRRFFEEGAMPVTIAETSKSP